MYYIILYIFCTWTVISAMSLLLSKLMYKISKRILEEKRKEETIRNENEVLSIAIAKGLFLFFNYIYFLLIHSWGYRSKFYIKKRIGEYMFIDWKGNLHLIVEKDKIEHFKQLKDNERMNMLIKDLKSEQDYLRRFKSVRFSTFSLLIKTKNAKLILDDDSFKHTKSAELSDWVKSSYCTNLMLLWSVRNLYRRKRLIDLIDGLELVGGDIDLRKLSNLEIPDSPVINLG